MAKPTFTTLWQSGQSGTKSGSFFATREQPATVAVTGSADITLQIRTGNDFVDVREYNSAAGGVSAIKLNASTGASTLVVQFAGEFRLSRASANNEEARVYFDA